MRMHGHCMQILQGSFQLVEQGRAVRSILCMQAAYCTVVVDCSSSCHHGLEHVASVGRLLDGQQNKIPVKVINLKIVSYREDRRPPRVGNVTATDAEKRGPPFNSGDDWK